VGIKNSWCRDLLESLNNSGIACEITPHPKLILINAVDFKVTINCISLFNDLDPVELLAIQSTYAGEGRMLVQMWEDVWLSKRRQVLSRIKSLAGKNIRLHGRKTELVQLTKPNADAFLMEHHLQGPVLARHKFGLLNGTELVAVATFSGTRVMKHKGDDYRSAELIRFASKAGYTITGGLSKIIKHFIAQVKTNDVMSYADRDWSTGKGYESAGFTFEGSVPPTEIWLDLLTNKRYFSHRLPALSDEHALTGNAAHQKRFLKIFNTGNLKYILYL